MSMTKEHGVFIVLTVKKVLFVISFNFHIVIATERRVSGATVIATIIIKPLYVIGIITTCNSFIPIITPINVAIKT